MLCQVQTGGGGGGGRWFSFAFPSQFGHKKNMEWPNVDFSVVSLTFIPQTPLWKIWQRKTNVPLLQQDTVLYLPVMYKHILQSRSAFVPYLLVVEPHMKADRLSRITVETQRSYWLDTSLKQNRTAPNRQGEICYLMDWTEISSIHHYCRNTAISGCMQYSRRKRFQDLL